jgi:hypothetical protein
VGGQLWTYIAGTSTLKATYDDSTGIGANTNPVILDGMGSCNLWLHPGLYKFILQDATGQVLWTVDNIGSNNSVFNLVTTLSGASGLRTLPPASSVAVSVLGYYAPGDGGGGTFYWDSNSTADDDGGCIITPNAGGIGRWIRTLDGYVSPKFFGAYGDGVTDDTFAVDAADTFATTNPPCYVLISNGTYNITQPGLGAEYTFSADGGLKWGVGINPTIHATITDDAQHFYVTGNSNAPVLTGMIEVLPEWFGAKGDGSFASNTVTTDDTNFIQQAFNACTPGMWVVFNSSKKYFCNAIVLPNLNGICGANFRGSQSFESDNNNLPAAQEYQANLQYIGTSGDFFSLLDNIGGIRGPVVRDLIIDGAGVADNIIHLQTYESLIENCTIRNSNGFGVLMDQVCSGTTVRNCNIYNHINGIIGNSATAKNNRVESCNFYSCSGTAIGAVNGSGWIVESNVIYTSGISIEVGGTGYSILNNTCVDILGKGIVIQNTQYGNSIISTNNISCTTGTAVATGIHITSVVPNYILVSNNTIYQGASATQQGRGIQTVNAGGVFPGNLENNQIVGYTPANAYVLADAYVTGQAYLDSTAYKTFREIIGPTVLVDGSDQAMAQLSVINGIDKADGSSTLISAFGAPSNAVNLWNRDFVTVDNTSALSRVHNSVGYDNTNFKPRKDTYTWEEKDPVQGRFYWGNLAQEYMHLDANGLQCDAITIANTAAVITPAITYGIALHGFPSPTTDFTAAMNYQTFLKMTTINIPYMDGTTTTTHGATPAAYINSWNLLTATDTANAPVATLSLNVGPGLYCVVKNQTVQIDVPGLVMEGYVKSYDFGTGVVAIEITSSTGTGGTFSSWAIHLTSFPFSPSNSFLENNYPFMVPFTIYGPCKAPPITAWDSYPIDSRLQMDNTHWTLWMSTVGAADTNAGSPRSVVSYNTQFYVAGNTTGHMTNRFVIPPQSINLIIA